MMACSRILNSRIDREGSAFGLEPHRLAANRKAGSSRRDISGFFWFRFTESRLDLLRFYAGRRIAGLIQIPFFGSVTHHSGVGYLGRFVRRLGVWLICHANLPAQNATTLPLCPMMTLAASEHSKSGSETTQSALRRGRLRRALRTRPTPRLSYRLCAEQQSSPADIFGSSIRDCNYVESCGLVILDVTFQGCEPSDDVRATIEREFERLETHDRRITSGRVTVIAPGDHHRHGASFQIHILLTMPPNENIVVSHSPADDGRHQHAEVAVKDAFAAARRQVEDRRQTS
jgi:hypothetical protein